MIYYDTSNYLHRMSIVLNNGDLRIYNESRDRILNKTIKTIISLLFTHFVLLIIFTVEFIKSSDTFMSSQYFKLYILFLILPLTLVFLIFFLNRNINEKAWINVLNSQGIDLLNIPSRNMYIIIRSYIKHKYPENCNFYELKIMEIKYVWKRKLPFLFTLNRNSMKNPSNNIVKEDLKRDLDILKILEKPNFVMILLSSLFFILFLIYILMIDDLYIIYGNMVYLMLIPFFVVLGINMIKFNSFNLDKYNKIISEDDFYSSDAILNIQNYIENNFPYIETLQK